MRIRKGAAMAAAACLLLSACSAGGGTSSNVSPSPDPASSVSSQPAPTLSATTVSPIPTPSTTTPRLHDLSWREYFGAYVPTGRGGPMKISADSASGWTHDRAGAAFAAAHYAVTADPRQPARIWKPVIKTAVPATARTTAITSYQKAKAGPPAGDLDEQPFAVWRPNVRVVGYSALTVTGARAEVMVWARSDGDSIWRKRTIRLRWTTGDWRLDLAKRPSRWAQSSPPEGLKSYSAL